MTSSSSLLKEVVDGRGHMVQISFQQTSNKSMQGKMLTFVLINSNIISMIIYEIITNSIVLLEHRIKINTEI